MICNDFSYNGTKLSDYDYIVVASEELQEFVGFDRIASEITPLNPQQYLYGVQYNGTLVLHMNIIKNPCTHPIQKDAFLTGVEINTLRSWLESPRNRTELFCYKDSGTLRYFGVFTQVSPLVLDDMVYGLALTFTCDEPYGYTPIRTSHYDMTGIQTLTATFDNTSCETESYLYPSISIIPVDTFGSNDILTIENITEGQTMTLTLPANYHKLNINCKRKIITDRNGNLVPMSKVGVTTPSNSKYDFVSAEKYFFYWLRFKGGVNDIKFHVTSSSLSEIQISARFPYKTGGF